MPGVLSQSTRQLHHRPRPLLHGSYLVALSLLLATSVRADKLFSPYWYVDDTTTGRIYVTNNGDAAKTVTPILTLTSSTSDLRLTLPAVSVGPEEIVAVEIDPAVAAYLRTADGPDPRWGDGSRRNSQVGAAELESSDLGGITAQIVSESQSESLSVGALFQAREWGFTKLGQLWWMPSATTRVHFALQNMSTSNLRLTANVVGPSGSFAPTTLVLSPLGRALVDLQSLLPGVSPLPSHGFVSFEFEDPGDLDEVPQFVGRTLVIDSSTGLSSSAAMDNPELLVSPRVQIPGLMIGPAETAHGYPAGTVIESKLVVANTSSSPVSFTPRVYWRGLFSLQETVLDLRTLAANSVGVFDVRDELLAAHPEVPDGMLNLVIDHDADPGTFFSEIAAVDSTLTFGMKCPLVDVATAGVQKVAVRFDFSGQRNTVLTAVNTSDLPVEYVFVLSYGVGGLPGRFESPTYTLGPQETVVVDLRALRDGAVSDRNGRVIPTTVTTGSAGLIATEPVLLSIDATADPVGGSVILCEEMCHRLHYRLRSVLCGATVPTNPDPVSINNRLYKIDPSYLQQGCARRFDGRYLCKYMPCQILPQCGNQPGFAVWSAPALGAEASWLRLRIGWINSCVLLWVSPLPYYPC